MFDCDAIFSFYMVIVDDDDDLIEQWHQTNLVLQYIRHFCFPIMKWIFISFFSFYHYYYFYICATIIWLITKTCMLVCVCVFGTNQKCIQSFYWFNGLTVIGNLSSRLARIIRERNTSLPTIRQIDQIRPTRHWYGHGTLYE